MLFGSRDLALRIEQAECGLLEAAVAAVSERRPERGAEARRIGGGIAAWSGEGSPLNKVAGLGFAPLPGPAELADMERFFATRGCPVQVEVSNLADPGLLPLLGARGYRLVAFENVLGRDLRRGVETPASAGDAARAEPIDTAGFDRWLDTVASGFVAPDGDGIPSHETFARETLEEILGDMAGVPGFVRYLAWRGDAAAGAASMRLQGGVAQLTGASTLPAHRRRGVQTALLRRRLADAADQGCDVAVVATQPGSRSQKNAQRNGFELLYSRGVLILEEPG